MKLYKSIFGMVHLCGVNPVERALEEIKIYENEGLQGIIVENYHGTIEDVIEVLQNVNTKLEIGVNILPNEYSTAFTISNLYNAKFIQLDYISGKYGKNTTLDEADYLSYRNRHSNISVFGGVWPKYYVPAAGSNLENDLKNAMTLCDAIVVTGAGTGKETPIDKIKSFRNIIGDFPLIIGAGLNAENISQMEYADGAIVGSCFKPNTTSDMVDAKLVSKFMKNLK